MKVGLKRLVERVMDNSRLDKFATGQFATFANFNFGQFATLTLVNSRLLFWTIRDFFCRESSKIFALKSDLSFNHIRIETLRYPFPRGKVVYQPHDLVYLM